MSNTELKPCPFCGVEAKIKWEPRKEISETSGVFRLSVKHDSDCFFVQMNGTNHKSEMISNTEERLIEVWNRRA